AAAVTRAVAAAAATNANSFMVAPPSETESLSAIVPYAKVARAIAQPSWPAGAARIIDLNLSAVFAAFLEGWPRVRAELFRSVLRNVRARPDRYYEIKRYNAANTELREESMSVHRYRKSSTLALASLL